MPCDESNLIMKALAFMRQRYGLKEHFHIRVEKRIPMQAGLAGGSADAGRDDPRRARAVARSASRLNRSRKRPNASEPMCHIAS